MAEQQAKHRQEIEQNQSRANSEVVKKYLIIESRNSLFGLLFGFLIGMTTIITGGFLVIKGHDISGSILGVSGITSLVGTFIYGSRNKNKPEDNQS